MAVRMALAGNPNCGKSTLFNTLTGSDQYIGNWPGVTVEKKEGRIKGRADEVTLVDLPGIYALSPFTLEEVVTRDFILKEEPDVIIDVIDVSNIERNMYLTLQLIDIGVPVVLALNMIDVLEKSGMTVDIRALSELTGVPVVAVSALRETGLDELIDTAVRTAKAADHMLPPPIFKDEIELAVRDIREMLPDDIAPERARWYAVKLLENDPKVAEEVTVSDPAKVALLRKALEAGRERDIESLMTEERYAYIGKLSKQTVRRPEVKLSRSDKIDRVVTNPWLGVPIFIAVMFVVYYISITTVGGFMTDWTNEVFVVWLQNAAASGLALLGAGSGITGLICDGIIGGVGSILGFIPQMFLVFLFLSVLEDCGYMVRIAFVMDRLFRRFGLSGKSFIPMVISAGCGAPGIMASKTIEKENDRRLTIMTTTFIPCGAKLPIIALMAAIIGKYATGSNVISGLVGPMMYVVGILAVLISGLMLKKTKPFAGQSAPFVMELPRYHIPAAKIVWRHVWERLRGFIIKAGTILFVASVIMWLLVHLGVSDGRFGFVDSSVNSLMAIIGGFISPIFRPLGFGNWQAVTAVISGFSAKESIVSTMSVLAFSSEAAAEIADAENYGAIAGAVQTWFPSVAAAISFLIFNMLDSPCVGAIATMAKEMNSRKWFWAAIIYQNVFAYIVCMIIYQLLGLAVGAVGFNPFTIVALVLLTFLLFMIFRPDPYKGKKVSSRAVK